MSASQQVYVHSAHITFAVNLTSIDLLIFYKFHEGTQLINGQGRKGLIACGKKVQDRYTRFWQVWPICFYFYR